MSCLRIVSMLLLCPFVTSESHYFASVERMKYLVNTERQLIPVLRNLQQTLVQVNRLIGGYLEEVEKIPDESPETLAKDPLFNFQLLRRFILDLSKIIELLSVDIIDPDFVYPEKEELESASVQLFRLQNLYDLNVQDMVQGKLKENLKSFTQLTTEETIVLSKSENPLANAWKQVALQKFLTDVASLDDEEVTAKMNRVKDVLTYLEFSLGDTEDQSKRLNRSEEKNMEEYTIEKQIHFEDDYKKLCNGVNMRTPLEEKDLSCELVSTSHPYFLLRPIKMEIYSKSPPVMMFYDVLNTEEMEVLKTLAEPQLDRSVTDNEVDPHYRRTSHTTWLEADDHPIATRVSEKATWYSGLVCPDSDMDCESLQLVNYGIGGEYYGHLDEEEDGREEIQLDIKSPGVRIATFMFYLNDVEFGGRTVFPKIKISATPMKGSAILWYNLFPNGTVDQRTVHGGCPVLYGSKWIATKWIGDKAQMFVRPCALQQNIETMKRDLLTRDNRNTNHSLL